MTKKEKLTYSLSLFLAMCVLLTVVHFYSPRGVLVSIFNNTEGTIRDLEIFYTGGVVRLQKLESNSTFRTYINPISESHLELKWFDANNVEHFQSGGGYFEHNYRGKINITIKPAGKILWTGEVQLPIL